MSRIIYDGVPQGSQSAWRVECDPMQRGHNDLVRFVRATHKRKCLDQIAAWTSKGWGSGRWMPKPPTVPAWLIELVEAHMRGQGQ